MSRIVRPVEPQHATEANGAFVRRNRTWPAKLRDALRGFKRGVRGESSFFVHFFAMALVVAMGVALEVRQWEWLLIAICVTIVLVAELLNTAIERLARAVDERPNPNLRDALDIGSASVLLAAFGASVVGVMIFGYRLYALFFGGPPAA